MLGQIWVSYRGRGYLTRIGGIPYGNVATYQYPLADVFCNPFLILSLCQRNIRDEIWPDMSISGIFNVAFRSGRVIGEFFSFHIGRGKENLALRYSY